MSSEHVDLILLDDLKETMPNRLNDMVRIAVLLDDRHRYKP